MPINSAAVRDGALVEYLGSMYLVRIEGDPDRGAANDPAPQQWASVIVEPVCQSGGVLTQVRQRVAGDCDLASVVVALCEQFRIGQNAAINAESVVFYGE